MSTKDSDIYIKILKYVQENGPVTHSKLLDEFKQHQALVNNCFQSNTLLIPAGLKRHKNRSNEPLKMLSFEGRFNLLEYEELQDARKSSKQAMIVAIISIILTLFSIIYSLFTIQKVLVTNSVTIKKEPPVSILPTK